MSDVLERNEVDTLLDSFSDGDAGPEGDARPSGRGARALAARTYDFSRPERVGEDQIRALTVLHETFSRNFSATLAGLLRTIVDVRVAGVEQLTYADFANSLPNPTCIVVVQAPPLEGRMCLEFSPPIVYPIIDRLLGGVGAAAFVPQRPLTAIEWRLVRRLIDRALAHLSETWRAFDGATFQAIQTECNPQLVHVVPPSEVAIRITFEIKLGQFAGTMSLCIPYNVIEPVMGRLTHHTRVGFCATSADEACRKRLTRNLLRTTVELRAYVGRTRIRLSQLRALCEGDVLELDKPADGEFIARVAERNKFCGTAGQIRGHKALCITRFAECDEPL